MVMGPPMLSVICSHSFTEPAELTQETTMIVQQSRGLACKELAQSNSVHPIVNNTLEGHNIWLILHSVHV